MPPLWLCLALAAGAAALWGYLRRSGVFFSSGRRLGSDQAEGRTFDPRLRTLVVRQARLRQQVDLDISVRRQAQPTSGPALV